MAGTAACTEPGGRTLGLPSLSWLALEHLLRLQRKALHLHAYSPTLNPPPPDWNPHRQVVTGYWRSSISGRPLSPDLAAFLAAGPPPVYVGFGSILAGRDPDGMTRLLVEALHKAGMRGVLYQGWGDLGNITLPPTVLAIRSAPHEILFPRCAVVVHHGGAGTTSAALHTGIPAVALPVFGDQFFWARCLYEQKASPSPISRRALTVQKLAAAIVAARDNPLYKQQTRVLQNDLARENGAENAACILEQWRAS